MPKPFEACRSHLATRQRGPKEGLAYIDELLGVEHSVGHVLPHVKRLHDIAGRELIRLVIMHSGKVIRNLGPAGQFGGIGVSAEGATEHGREPLLRIAVRLLDQAFRPEFGLACNERIVQQRQRLGGRVGLVTAAGGHFRRGLIEGSQELRRLHDRHLDIDRPATIAIERAGKQTEVGICSFVREGSMVSPKSWRSSREETARSESRIDSASRRRSG